jgi:hypothetical protein
MFACVLNNAMLVWRFSREMEEMVGGVRGVSRLQ